MKIKKFKKCRKFGSAIYEKCASAKFAISEQKKRFAQKGKRRNMLTEYGKKLIEKQKLRLSYGLKEKKMRSYVMNAIDSAEETFSNLNEKLETRLDNVIYRLALGSTRAMSKQIVSHGHIMVNEKKLDIPSYQVKIGDKISVREQSKDRAFLKDIEKKDKPKLPLWLKFNYKDLSGTIEKKPELENSEFNFQQIIEFYTR